MFDSLFGFGSNLQPQVDQLFQLHASWRYATIAFLNGDIKSQDGLGDQVQTYSMELYSLINKTRIIDEYDYWGLDGDGSHRKEKVNKSTTNTSDAIFALINNNKEKFDKLVEEGPTPDQLELHNKQKIRSQESRDRFLERVRSCDPHVFNTGFMEYNSCRNCGLKKDRSNVE